MRVIDFEEKLKILPNLPGCYLYLDLKKEIIYVGKSKDLKKRVNSYFNRAHNSKTALLVNEIYDFEFVVTKSDLEALILELNLIKENTPKYNIKLNDDATYPYIQVSRGKNPKIIITRNPKKKNGKVFGPFPNSYAATQTVKLLNKLYPLRSCKKLPKKECLYYHLNQCLGPCIKKIDPEIYQNIVKEIYAFLKGDTKLVLADLKKKMNTASENLDFENAKEHRNLIYSIEKIVEKQQISLNDFQDRDIFGYYANEKYLCVSIFYYRRGKVIARDVDITEYIEEVEQAFINYLLQFYINYARPKPKEILVPFECDELKKLLDVKIIIPKIGNKKKLLDMARNNALHMIKEKELLLERKKENTVNACVELGEILNIEYPKVIECFDNSNIQGTASVSGMVQYLDGVANKRGYRKFKIKTVEGPDDYATLKEVIYRRYLSLLTKNLPLPDLIIVDGGMGQVSSTLQILNSLNLDIPLIGLMKDSNHKTESIVTKNKKIIKLNKRSKIYKLLANIQEEVHRFAINYHRNVRSKSLISSILDNIEGIGEKRKILLYKNFDSIESMRNSDISEFTKIGISNQLAIRIKKTLLSDK